ncbi:MAG: DUF4199 domain-containing protein [Verrucomicrobiales bacterium]|nr:DUF4199 domain-containing protein [Verrucomicrobiales bacterium]
MRSLELRWGLIIGSVNMGWLFLSYYLGMHDQGLGMIQVMTLVSVLLSVVGYLLGLRDITFRFPDTQYKEGLRSGAIIAGIVAVFAALSQVIYFKLINPGWTEQMVELTRNFYLESGLPETEAEQFAEGAKQTFGLTSYMIQSALGAIIIGMISTAIILMFLRKRRA